MFQKIKATVDIVQHIGQHVELRQGNPLSGLCPFHEEKTPSFKVWADHWWCFGCSFGGSVIDFEMHRQNLNAVDAAQSLCQTYNIVVSREESERYARAEAVRKEKQDIALMLPTIGQQRPEIMDYLHKERGFSDDTIKAFGVGVGLREKVVVIPIKDKYGRVVAFAKRHLDPEQVKLHKWVNDAEDSIYDKKSILFNLDQARRHLTPRDHLASDQRIILVESYFDVMALWEAGVKTGIAYCSARLSKEQVLEIKGMITPGTSLVFSACNDKVAQDKLLANRMMVRTMCPDVHIRALVLPDGSKDLNDVLLNEGSTGLNKIVTESVSMDIYLIDQVLKTEPVLDIQYRKAKQIVGLAENIMSQKDMISHLSRVWGKEETTVTQYMQGKAEETGPTIQFRDIPTLITEYENYIRTIDQHRIFFGWPEYDRVTRGMKPGDVVQFIARSGTGKTMWAQQLQLSIGGAMPHIPMINYSLEQKAIMTFERYMQMEGGLLSSDVEKWIVADDDAHNTRIFNTAQSLTARLKNLLICDDGGLTLEQIEAHTRQAGFAYFGKPVGIIFIDYLGYLKMSGNQRNLYETVSLIARQQKEVAKRLNCVIVSLHQITKAGRPGEEISATHARDSGAVEDSADIMIGAWRPELKEGILDTEKHEVLGKWRTKFLKNRYGPSEVVVDFKFIPEFLRLAPGTTDVISEAVAKPVNGDNTLQPPPGFIPDKLDGKERASGEGITA